MSVTWNEAGVAEILAAAPEHLRPIITTLFTYEDWLSDGFGYYLPNSKDQTPNLYRIAQALYDAAQPPKAP